MAKLGTYSVRDIGRGLFIVLSDDPKRLELELQACRTLHLNVTDAQVSLGERRTYHPRKVIRFEFQENANSAKNLINERADELGKKK